MTPLNSQKLHWKEGVGIFPNARALKVFKNPVLHGYRVVAEDNLVRSKGGIENLGSLVFEMGRGKVKFLF